MCTHMYAHTTCTCAHMCMHVHTYTYTHVHPLTHARTHNTHTSTYTYTHVFMVAQALSLSTGELGTVDPWNSLTSYPSPMGNLRSVKTPVSKHRVKNGSEGEDKPWGIHLCWQGRHGRDRQIPEAYWPASLDNWSPRSLRNPVSKHKVESNQETHPQLTSDLWPPCLPAKRKNGHWWAHEILLLSVFTWAPCLVREGNFKALEEFGIVALKVTVSHLQVNELTFIKIVFVMLAAHRSPIRWYITKIKHIKFHIVGNSIISFQQLPIAKAL